MKAGDMVRFAYWNEVVDIDDWSTTPKKNVGILVEYDNLMQIAYVLHGGEVLGHRVQLVEKAGKRDGLVIEEMGQKQKHSQR